MTGGCRIRTAAAVIAVGVLVGGCGGDVAGVPVGSSYRVDPSTATATPVDLENALAVSRDGAMTAVVQDDRFCLRVRTGGSGASATCAEDAQLAEAAAATFSPDGSRVVVFGSRSLGAGTPAAWIVTTSTGVSVPIQLPGGRPAATSSGAPSGTDAPRPRPGDSVTAAVWQSEDTLITVGFSGTVYRVAGGSGTGTLLTIAGTRGRDAVTMASLGGGTLVLSIDRASGGGSRIVAVSLADGTVRDPVLDFGPESSRPVLMGVSPDGTRALLSTADLNRLQPGRTEVLDLTSGRQTEFPGTDDTYALAGGFSPDGAAIAIVGTGPVPQGSQGLGEGNSFTLQLAPADAGTAPRSIADADPSTAFGTLLWSDTGFVVAATTNRQAAAWTITG